ncbi:MAG: hypothetical protein GKC02_10175 [Methanomassiliicoccales archaeon]|nr:hypothetical protein [Methanomassiliicoccales archaeon]
MKLDQVYRELLSLKVVTTQDITRAVQEFTDLKPRTQYVQTKYISPLKKRGLMTRVRRGLYYVRSPNEGDDLPEMDKFLVASRIRDNYYISHHAALEIHGAAESVFWTVHISVPQNLRFQQFHFNNVAFKSVSTKEPKMSNTSFPRKGKTVLASNPTRTFLDCIDRPDYVGGWEECLKSLSSLPGIDVNELVDLIDLYDKSILNNKAGYVLDLLRQNSVYYEHISDDGLSRIEERLNGLMYYLSGRERTQRSKRWNLYIPIGFETYLRGI